MNARIVLAAAAAISIALTTLPADARQLVQKMHGFDVAAAPAYPVAGPDRGASPARGAHIRAAKAPRTHRQAKYAAKASQRPALGVWNLPGSLVVVPTAAGIQIKASVEFAPRAQAVIAAAVAEGIRFRRINCFSMARSHRSLSNHKTGDACDSYPSIPARIVRAAGLRSGCDFADCQHFDNARNVGGMALWNQVRHKTRYAARQRISAAPTLEMSAASRHGVGAAISAKLRRWVRPTGQCAFGETERLATYYNSGSKTANGERFLPHGNTAAHRTLPFGTRLTVRNPATGRTVLVTVNDRGPFTIAWIDLAHGAARQIGMTTSIYVCVSNSTYAEAGRQ